MGRPARTDNPGGRYHVVNRGVDRATIFRDDRDRLEFERLIGVAHDRFGVVAHAYCWMTNHYHVVLDCPDGGLSDAMHLIGSVFVRHANERHGRDGPLFADRFYARPILSDAYLLRCVRYIHQNPAAIVGSDQLETYRWSSLRAYLGHRRSQPWLRTADVLEWVGGSDQLRRLTVGIEEVSLPDVDASEWMHAIDLVLDAAEPELGLERAGRTVAALVLDRLPADAQARLRDELGYPNREALAAARYRARRAAKLRPELVAAVDEVIGLAA